MFYKSTKVYLYMYGMFAPEGMEASGFLTGCAGEARNAC